jgi:hypothetical protein
VRPRLSEAFRRQVERGEEEKNAVHPGSQSKRRKKANPECAGIFFLGKRKNKLNLFRFYLLNAKSTSADNQPTVSPGGFPKTILFLG